MARLNIMRTIMMVTITTMVGTSLTACSENASLNPFTHKDEKSTVEGERVAVLSGTDTLEVSENMKNISIDIPSGSSLSAWPQEGGSTEHNGGNIALKLTYNTQNRVSSGNGNAWDANLVAAPVASATHIFTMDGNGVVSAHSLDAINTSIWKQTAAKQQDTAFNGGGLALDDSTVYATTADGTITAMSTTDGKILWQQHMDMPIRSAPTLTSKALLVMTASSQLYAIDTKHGKILWRHSGIQESASLLGTVPPAEKDGKVIAVYPSGEVYGLNLDDGKVIWSDSLLLPLRTSALGTFSGVGGMPVIMDNTVFSASSNGLLIANQLNTGLRIWEQPISSSNTPWIAGDFLYVLTTDGKLVCLTAGDGRIVWISPIENYETAAKDGVTFKGPYMIDSALLLISSDGTWQHFNPQNGTRTKTSSMSSVFYSNPAFAGTHFFINGSNASLYSVQ